MRTVPSRSKNSIFGVSKLVIAYFLSCNMTLKLRFVNNCTCFTDMVVDGQNLNIITDWIKMTHFTYTVIVKAKRSICQIC